MNLIKNSIVKRLAMIGSILLILLIIVLISSANLRNKLGCLLLISGVNQASCVVNLPLPLDDDVAEAEALALGYEAYTTGVVYARSQILMEKDTHPDAPLNAPINEFNIYPNLATPDSAIDFTPNNDTVYGLAWLDLSQGPIIIDVPEIPNRYMVIQATDWALNTFAYIGTRVHSKPGRYAYVPKGWHGEIPNVIETFEAPTNGVFLQARIVVTPETPEDIQPVVAMLKSLTLTPLNKNAIYAKTKKGTPVPNPKLNNPIWQSLDFYTLLNRAWTFGGVRDTDKEVVKQFSRLGIGPNLTFDPEKLTAAQRRGLEKAAKMAFQRVPMHGMERGKGLNSWRFTTLLGSYGSDRLLASTVAMMGYGANKAEEALYLPAFLDNENQPLISGRKYKIHFSANNFPPVNYFWSITLYSRPENQLKANPINRYAIGDRTPSLVKNADGSIDIFVQEQPLSKEQKGNWLPSGEPGQFWMILRMYGPKESVLAGNYIPPEITRVR